MTELATFVLLPYRGGDFVAEAIRAVAKQTYRPLELIVTYDVSPDFTHEKIDAALRDFLPTSPSSALTIRKIREFLA